MTTEELKTLGKTLNNDKLVRETIKIKGEPSKIFNAMIMRARISLNATLILRQRFDAKHRI